MNKLTMMRENYKTDEDFNLALGNAVRFFADNDYQMKCYWDDKDIGVFVIEFDYQDVGLSGWELVWEKI